jgi:hypothetical protein
MCVYVHDAVCVQLLLQLLQVVLVCGVMRVCDWPLQQTLCPLAR